MEKGKKGRKGQRGAATGDCGVEEMSSKYLFSGGIVKHDFPRDRWHLLHAKLPYAPRKGEQRGRGRN